MSSGEPGGLNSLASVPRYRIQDFKTLGWYLFFMLIAGYGTFRMVVFGWDQWGLLRQVLRGVTNALQVTTVLPYYVPTGLFIGLLATLLLDPYKRIHAVLLGGTVTVASVVVLLAENELIMPLLRNLTPIGAGVFTVSVLLGLAVGGVTVRKVAVALDGGDAPFPRAPRAILVLAAAVFVVGWFEASVVYTSPVGAIPEGGVELQPGTFGGIRWQYAIGGAIVSGIALYCLSRFTKYESQSSVLILGPQRSGKTACIGGLRDAIDDPIMGLTNKRANDIKNDIERGDFPDPNERRGGDADAQPDADWIEFGYKQPDTWFPTQVQVATVDYPGEILDDIVEPLTAETDGGQFVGETGLRADGRLGTVGEKLEKLRERLDGSTDDGGSRRQRSGTISTLEDVKKKVNRANDDDDVAGAVRGAIKLSDHIVLVVPMDDFLAPIVARGGKERLPEYAREDVVVISADDDDEDRERKRSKVDQSWANWQPFDGHLGRGWFNYRSEKKRPDPEVYLSLYAGLTQRFGDTRPAASLLSLVPRLGPDRTGKEFTTIATMADWASEDYMAERSIPAIGPTAYDGFCGHIYEKVIAEQNPEYNDIVGFAGLDSEHPLAVWYDLERVPDGPEMIAESSPLEASADATEQARADGEGDREQERDKVQIDTDHDPTLRGADELLGRLSR